MAEIIVPTEGRPTEATSADDLIGIDSNAFSIIGFTTKTLRRAGASPEYLAEYKKQATTGGYDHLVAVSMAFLDASS